MSCVDLFKKKKKRSSYGYWWIWFLTIHHLTRHIVVIKVVHFLVCVNALITYTSYMCHFFKFTPIWSLIILWKPNLSFVSIELEHPTHEHSIWHMQLYELSLSWPSNLLYKNLYPSILIRSNTVPSSFNSTLLQIYISP